MSPQVEVIHQLITHSNEMCHAYLESLNEWEISNQPFCFIFAFLPTLNSSQLGSVCLYHNSLTSANSFQFPSGAMPNQPISLLQLHHHGDQLQQTIKVVHFPAFGSNWAVFETKIKQK